jgi:hypothetical protein
MKQSVSVVLDLPSWRRKECYRAPRAGLLLLAREIARRYAHRSRHRTCTVDDVTERLPRHGLPSTALGPAAGSIFRSEGWLKTCLRVRSRKLAARGREVKVWLLPRRGERPSGWAGGYSILVERQALQGAQAPSPVHHCCRCHDLFPELLGYERHGEWFCASCRELEEERW